MTRHAALLRLLDEWQREDDPVYKIPELPVGVAVSGELERGLSIVTTSECRVGAHVWIWSSSGTTEAAPPLGSYCRCGLVQWS